MRRHTREGRASACARGDWTRTSLRACVSCASTSAIDSDAMTPGRVHVTGGGTLHGTRAYGRRSEERGQRPRAARALCGALEDRSSAAPRRGAGAGLHARARALPGRGARRKRANTGAAQGWSRGCSSSPAMRIWGSGGSPAISRARSPSVSAHRPRGCPGASPGDVASVDCGIWRVR